ncbi:MAG: proton-conducting transporter membrane subunit, partial [Alphaproteobacteria bacterium]|nr:proton-conducting transporter membrane subunit [Alphaproteobacteria bacterium]
MSGSFVVGLAPLWPLVGAVMIWLSGSLPNVREGVTLVTAVVLLLLVASLAPAVMAGERPAAELFEVLPGVRLAFEVEPLGMLFALIASFLWLPNSLYAIGYMRAHHEQNQTRFYVCFAIALSSAVGVAFAANLFTLFLFYELLTISTYPLVTHAGTDKARRSGRVYLGVLIGTSIAFQLLAIMITWAVAGTMEFTVGGILAGNAEPATIGILFALY